MPSPSFVFPVRYVAEGTAVQSTSRQLTPVGIDVRSLSPPRVGTRLSMALYLPRTAIPEVAIGRVTRARADVAAEAGFWADFIVLDPQARQRISSLISERDTNQRGFPRLDVKLAVRFRTAKDFVVEHANNISRGGVFIHTAEPPPLDTAVQVELHLPNDPLPATTKGVVVHRQLAAPGKAPGVGVQFVDADDSFRVRIDRYMDSLLES